MIDHNMGCAALTGNCTCKSPAPKYTVEVPSGDVAEGFQKAINQAIHDAWQEGYAQRRKDERWERDAERPLAYLLRGVLPQRLYSRAGM